MTAAPRAHDPASDRVLALLEAFRAEIERALALGRDGEVHSVAVVRDGRLLDAHVDPARPPRVYPLRGSASD